MRRTPPLRATPGLVTFWDGLTRGFAALRFRNYRLYWFGQIVSLVGTWMQSVSQPWLVLQLGGSPIQLGEVLALQYLPSTLLAPFGGVLADRVDKRKALMITEFVAMVEAGILAVLTATGVVEIWHIFVLATLLGLVNAVDLPLRQAIAAELVPREALVNAIALNSASFNLARVIGPAVAGITLALAGSAFNFGLNAVSYLAVLLALGLMDPAKLHRIQRPERIGVLRSLAEGFDYARKTPTVFWPLVLLGGISTFGMNFQTLIPLYAQNTLGLDASGYGALFAVMGAGSLIGSLVLAFNGGRRPMMQLILGGSAVFLVAELGMGLVGGPMAAYGLILLVGLSSMLFVNAVNVSVQYGVPDALRGRVMALYVTVFAGSTPIGGFFAGSVAEVWGAPAGFVAGAGISALVLGLVSWGLLARRRAARRASVAMAGGESG
jgi:MFS family permease